MLRTRSRLAGSLASALVAAGVAMGVAAPGAWAKEFGIERFVAVNCKQAFPLCAQEAAGPFPEEPTLAQAKEQGYAQAAGHPPWGVTAFKVNTEEGTVFPNAVPSGVATGGVVTKVRTDIAPGLSTDPEAVPKCAMSEFEGEEFPPKSGSGFFEKPACNAETKIGTNDVVVWLGPKPSPEGGDLPLAGTVYNLVQPTGLSSDFGVALAVPKEVAESIFKIPISKQLYVHSFIEGHVEWASDYHDYFEINVSPTLPLISSRLEVEGNILLAGKENGGFLTNPSHCAGPGPLTTNTVTLAPVAGPTRARTYTTPIGTEGCLGEAGFEAPPFEPGFKLTPGGGEEETRSDHPDGITTEVTLPHDPNPEHLDSSQLRTATVTLPEGMTLNPAAAQGMEACTPAEIGIKTRNPVTCPAKSQLGTVTLTVPDLPVSEPLTGNVYLGGGPTITGQPYKVYLDAESPRYGISTRLEGTVTTNESTGRVTTVFAENPEQPFSDAKLAFRGGALAPIANPLTCGTALTETSFVPYTGTATKTPSSSFTVDGNGKGGACASPLPFGLSQSTEDHPPGGGEAANFTLNLARPDGNQYLARASTKLPLGLVGKIPAVPPCPEPNAAAGTCPVASQIGKVAATVGSGPTPARFEGPVYLTGPTEKAPYGMTMVVNAAVGPFSLGNDVVRTRIEVEPYTARVVVAGNVPTIFKGIPLRLKALSVSINRQGFLVNPTNCGTLATESTLGSSGGATQTVSTPFQVTGCSGLAFKPKFGAETSGKTSRANGASLIVHVNRPKGLEANIKSVLVTVPRHMPSRLSTLNHACREAVFAANPANCPANSKVGTARIKTPVLPGQLSGPAYFVSHGGAKFPDLDLVVSGSGVTVILVGNTNISNGITTTRFRALPDVPFSGFELKLPQDPNSALGANGNLCRQSLVMPTTITAQNGKVIKQNTRIAVKGCPVSVVYRFVRGHEAVVVAHAPAAGRVSGSGPNLRFVTKHTGKAGNVTLYVPLSSAGLRNLAARGRLFVRVRVGFLPKNKRERASVAYTTVVF